ncbi:MAG: transposase [Clostridiales bacterium]|nr:transposase [Clostridiales bacterium]
MITDPKKAAFRILFLITTPRLSDKAGELFCEGQVPVQYHFRAQGTASGEMMDMLGLGSVEKNVLMSIMPKPFANEMLKKLQKRLLLGTPNSGVAFTVALSGSCGRLIRLIEPLQPEAPDKPPVREDAEMSENRYAMIMAIVNQGYSEEVMEAARPVGASGGTVFHSRRVGNEETLKFWGISVQQEREVVIILARNGEKRSIMQAINERCGMQSDAHGVVLSLPVDAVAGLD